MAAAAAKKKKREEGQGDFDRDHNYIMRKERWSMKGDGCKVDGR